MPLARASLLVPNLDDTGIFETSKTTSCPGCERGRRMYWLVLLSTCQDYRHACSAGVKSRLTDALEHHPQPDRGPTQPNRETSWSKVHVKSSTRQLAALATDGGFAHYLGLYWNSSSPGIEPALYTRLGPVMSVKKPVKEPGVLEGEIWTENLVVAFNGKLNFREAYKWGKDEVRQSDKA